MQSIRQYRPIQRQTQWPLYESRLSSLSKAEYEAQDFTNSSVPTYGSNRGSTNAHILVDWNGELDPEHPRNWSGSSKLVVSAIVFINVFVLDWCSSVNSQTGNEIAADFHVSGEAESLSSACYVWGIALGALSAGPISETVGRNPIYMLSRILHLAFILGTALAPNLGAQLPFRFFAGLGASTILAIHGASISDIWGPEERSIVWPFVALGSFLGTAIAPIVSGWIAHTSTSWRWGEWIALIMTGLTLLINSFFLPETFAPILIKWKAKSIRTSTGNDRYWAEIEKQSSFWKLLGRSYRRAFDMTTKEYIVILLGIWLIVVYIVVFGFLKGFDFLFKDTYSLSRGLTGTCFAAIVLGICLNTLLAPIFAQHHRHLAKRWKQVSSPQESLPPEYRLLPAFPVALALPISLFWLGWTNYTRISIWSGLGAVTLFGYAWAGIYVSIYQYILDIYGIYAGSALASITFARYMASGGMTLASRPMWQNLDTHWTCTLLGCLATVLVPVPFVFYRWGRKVRAISRFAGAKMLLDNAENASEEENEPV